MMKKRGLSAVVTTLIIILLVLVAVGILWVVVRNLIEQGAEQIELGKFTLDLQIESVQIQGDDVNVTVMVRRNPGKGDFIGMNFIFSDGKESEIIREDTVLNELDVVTFTFTLTKFSTSELEEVSVAPIYESSSGKEIAGDLADSFEVPKGSVVTGGAIEEISNFESFGLVGWGTADYQVSSGGDKLPVIERVIIDPLDVAVGEIQTFIAYVTSPNEITEVITRTQLDNEVLILPLEKTENENEYMATWEVYDTHTTTYRTNFTASDSAGNENTITMSWTDPCTSLGDHGTEKVISTACTVGSGVDGIDVGNIRLNSGGSITMNGGTFIRTPGYSMFFSGGTLTLAGGEVREAYIYYVDADNDGYGNGYAWSASSSLSGHIRANLATGSSDCADAAGNGNVYQFKTVADDTDNDRSYTGSLSSRCVGAKTSFWYKDVGGADKWIESGDTRAQNVDCDTANSNVWWTATGTNIDSDQDGYEVGSPGSGVSRCIGGIETRIEIGPTNRRYYNSPDGTHDYQVWSDRIGSNDCNDASSSTWLNAYTDSDGDGFGVGSLSCGTSGASNNNDCDDTFASNLGSGCGLVNNAHTSLNCVSVGGTVVVSGSNGLCKRTVSSCFSGWTPYLSWSRTTSETANDGVGACEGIENVVPLDPPIDFIPLSTPLDPPRDFIPLVPCGDTMCNTGSHFFSNRAVETCSYETCANPPGCACPSITNTCTAKQTETGCY